MKKIYLLLFLIAFSSCEKEELKQEVESGIAFKEELEVSTLSKDQLQKNKKAYNFIKKFKDQLQSTKSRSGSDDKKFYVFEEGVKYIEYGDYHSYTFVIYRDEVNGLLENLLVSLQEDGSYKTYLISYHISEEERNLLEKGVFVSVVDKMEIYKIGYDADSLLLNKSYIRHNPDGTCDQVTETTGPHGFPVEQIIAGVDCSGGGGGDGSSGDGSSGGGGGDYDYDPGEPGEWPDYDDPGSGSGGGGGTSGGGEPTDPGDGTCIAGADGNCIGDITTPTLPPSGSIEDIYSDLFFETLGENNLQYWWTVNASEIFKTKLINYLLSERYSDEAEEFALAASFAEKAGGEVDFEEQIINNLTGKALCVYNKLKSSSSGFKNDIKKFDGDFPVSHLKFEKSTNLPSNTNAETSPPLNYLITITLNSNNLNRPNLSIARTIIHESIHAEMFRKILSIIDNGGDLNGLTRSQWTNKLSNGDYPGIFDYYSRYGVNGMQHQQMAAHYISTISNYLKEFQPGLSQQIYDSLAWTGLKDTTAWNSLTSTKRAEITNLINSFNSQGGENCN